MGRGLSEVEADAHMATVASTRKIPLFSSAVVLAGLDAGEVQSSTSKVEEEKAKSDPKKAPAPISSLQKIEIAKHVDKINKVSDDAAKDHDKHAKAAGKLIDNL